MSWLSEEKSRIDGEKKKRMENLDMREVLAIEEGTTSVKVDLNEEPRTAKTKYGDRKVVGLVEPVTPDKKKMCIMMSDYLYELFIDAVHDKKGLVKLNITRTGAGTDTKYVVKLVS